MGNDNDKQMNDPGEMGVQLMMKLDELGYVGLCAFGKRGEDQCDVDSFALAEPEDADLMEAMLAAWIGDYARDCEWDREELVNFLTFLTLDSMDNYAGNWDQEIDMPAENRRPNLIVLPPSGRKNGRGEKTEIDTDESEDE